MQALVITIFFSLLLAALFVLLYYRARCMRGFAGAEREALRPLDHEIPVEQPTKGTLLHSSRGKAAQAPE